MGSPAPAMPVTTSLTDRLRDAIAACLRSEDVGVGRLSYARTSVGFLVEGERDGAVPLYLDRRPPTLAQPQEPTEIVVTLSGAQAERFLTGRFSIVEGLIDGSVHATGPVRSYMEVDPILRRLLALQAGTDPDVTAPGDPAGPARAAHAIAPERLAVETRGLYKSFGSNRILDGCSLAVPEGVISVILGPSGTGKSVMLQHIIGLMKADAGDVVVRGNRLGAMSRSEILGLRREIGVMFQDGALFSVMNVFDNVAFPLRQHTNLDDRQIAEVVHARLRDVGLTHAAERMPGELSGGMRKRAGLARSLVLDPGIVLCDEPDSGLDPVRTSLLGDLLVEQHAEHGGTMIVVTHNVALARQISDHISVLWRGRVLEAGLSEEIFASQTPFVRQFLDRDTEGPLSMDA